MDLTLIDTTTARSTRTAFIIAAIVAAYLAAASLVRVLVSTIAEIFAVPDLWLIGSQWASFAAGLATSVAVFSLGVFLVLWAIAPITTEIRLRLVLARAALAALGGAVLTYLLNVVTAIVQSTTERVFWDTSNGVSLAELTVIGPLNNLVSTLLNYGPVVLLVSVLVWLWLRSGRQAFDDRPPAP